MVPLKEGYQVYTRTVGKGLPILLLHGGPGAYHECFEIMEEYVDLEQFSLIYYDQLGSASSDKITDTDLLRLERFVDEVEQVRAYLQLDKFVLLGHSWGAMLGIEYALKYENDGHLLGLVLSNMTASIDASLLYVDKLRRAAFSREEYEYAKQAEEEGRTDDERYQALVFGTLYPRHFCRLDPWPEFLREDKVAQNVYQYFQGDNEFVVTGAMRYWDRWKDLPDIQVKTLCIGAQYDTMNPEEMREMARLIPNADCCICPQGGHFCYWDDAEHYFEGLNHFLHGLI